MYPVKCLFPCSDAMLTLEATVVRSESVRNIIRERRMLEHVNHPFICNLRYSFQDIEYMYATLPNYGSASKRVNTSTDSPSGISWLIS